MPQIYLICNNMVVVDHDNSWKLESSVVGNPFVMLIHENGHMDCGFQNLSSKHNVLHPIVKCFNDVIGNVESIFHACPVFELFYKYSTEHTWIIKAWHLGNESVIVKFIFEYKWFWLWKGTKYTTTTSYFDNDEYPSKVIHLFKADRKPEIHAIVKSCESRNHGHDSILFSVWRKEITSKLVTHLHVCCMLCQLIHLVSMLLWSKMIQYSKNPCARMKFHSGVHLFYLIMQLCNHGSCQIYINQSWTYVIM